MDQRDTGSFKPRESRTNVDIKGTLWSDSLEPREIEIHNLSRRGVGARCRVGAPSPGEAVTIHVAGFPSITGSVRWGRSDQFGVSLDQDIDPALLAAPTAEQPAPDPRPGIDFDF